MNEWVQSWPMSRSSADPMGHEPTTRRSTGWLEGSVSTPTGTTTSWVPSRSSPNPAWVPTSCCRRPRRRNGSSTKVGGPAHAGRTGCSCPAGPAWATSIRPWLPRLHTPTLLVLASEDRVAPTSAGLAAFELLPGTKELLVIEGHHFTPYAGEALAQSANAALAFYQARLT
jgi:pimeloyl-ACP methyl ester carboxylesterase